jgi:hypothetical protein
MLSYVPTDAEQVVDGEGNANASVIFRVEQTKITSEPSIKNGGVISCEAPRLPYAVSVPYP